MGLNLPCTKCSYSSCFQCQPGGTESYSGVNNMVMQNERGKNTNGQGERVRIPLSPTMQIKRVLANPDQL